MEGLKHNPEYEVHTIENEPGQVVEEVRLKHPAEPIPDDDADSASDSNIGDAEGITPAAEGQPGEGGKWRAPLKGNFRSSCCRWTGCVPTSGTRTV